MTSIVASLRNLESLFSSLDKKVQANHADLDRKLDRLASEQRERYEFLEKAQIEHNSNIEKCKEQVIKHEERIDKVYSELEDANIPKLKATIFCLEQKVEELEKKFEALDRQGLNGRTEDFNNIMYALAKKTRIYGSKNQQTRQTIP